MLNLDEALCRLSEVKGNEDIKSLSFAKYPGTHCPLFGVAMIASFIKDMAVLVVGTSECTYYSKGFAYNNQHGEDNFYSLVIGKNDLTFGCGKKVISALKEIDKEKKYAAVMVVTTCVLEVIGEDIESLVIEHENELNVKAVVVNTEHFKCGSHIPGMERSLSALIHLMKPTEKKPKSINILGHRKHGVEKTEVISALSNEGVEIVSVIPSSCTIKDIEKASAASLNIVTDFTALPLARQMEKRLSVPFVYFGRHLILDKIEDEYKKIESVLGINILEHLEEKKTSLLRLEEKAKGLFDGKKLIYGNTPMMAFEVTDYLATIGMIPIFVQVREYYESEREDMDEILKKGFNPYIAQIANIAPMQGVYDILKPDIYLGHENPMSLFKKKIVQITVDEATEKIGFEVPITLLNKMISIYEMALASPDVPVGMMSMMGQMSMNTGENPMKKAAMSKRKSIKELLADVAEFAVDNDIKESGLDKNGLTPEMARAVEKGMPLAIAKMIAKKGAKR